ncbi:class I adenylate-forming enzyme family protein [Tepidamorphus sp. 3E244]|uniref:class I adenylate-forming enzyme family protein n=1 Tax=Tepidamorphus sp. 3E244 TaxID=3385498 RepID=UPI0038FD080C
MQHYLGKTASILDHASGLRLDRQALLAASAARAHELDAVSVQPGNHVVLAHGRGLETIIDLLAIWSLKAVALLVTPSLVATEKANIAKRTGAAVWVGPEAPEGCTALEPADPRANTEPRVMDVSPEMPALVLMTSGTTAKPKGVVLSHGALLARLRMNIDAIGAHDLNTSLCVLPVHFGHGLIGNCLTPLAAGGTLVPHIAPGAADLHGFGAFIDRHEISFLSSVPSLWRAVLKLAHPPQGSTLRRVHVGSAPLTSALWADIAKWAGTDNILNMYGITETANWIGGWSLRDGAARDGFVGKPWGMTLCVRDAEGAVHHSGKGEILVSGPALMSGYLDDPERTATAIDDDWFATGDTGEIDTDGNLFISGRIRNEINVGGIKIAAEEIDALLESHPDILEACAFPLPDPLSGEIVAVAVAPREGCRAPALADLRDWCETRIRREAIPARLFQVDALPRTDRGKLNRDAVRSLCTEEPQEHA